MEFYVQTELAPFIWSREDECSIARAFALTWRTSIGARCSHILLLDTMVPVSFEQGNTALCKSHIDTSHPCIPPFAIRHLRVPCPFHGASGAPSWRPSSAVPPSPVEASTAEVASVGNLNQQAPPADWISQARFNGEATQSSGE